MSKLTSPASGRPPRTVRRGIRFRHVAFLFLLLVIGAPVALWLIPTTRWADGTGYVMTDREVEIRPSVRGAVKKRLVGAGTRVKKGQLLVQLKASVQQAGFEGAQNRLRALEAELKRLGFAQTLEKQKLAEQVRRIRREHDNARTRLEKMKKAAGGGFSQQEIDDAQLKVDVAMSRLAELELPRKDLREKERAVLRERILGAEKEIDVHKAELELRKIRAAIDGTVYLHSFEPGEEIETADVWLGVQATVPLTLPDDFTITMSRAARKKLEVKVVLESPVPAPIVKGTEIATLVISAPEFKTVRMPLQAGADVERLGYFGRVWAAVIHTVFGAVGL